MNPEDKNNSRFAQMVTNQLLDSVRTGERVDPDLIAYAEEVIQVHQLVVQLSFVGLIVDRLPQLANYNEALDNLIEQLDTKDLAEASIGEKIRAASVLNASIKTTVDVINEMMSSKDAINMLITSLKNTFGSDTAVLQQGGASKNVIEKFQSLPSEQRQKLLAGAVTLIRDRMTFQETNMEDTFDDEDDG